MSRVIKKSSRINKDGTRSRVGRGWSIKGTIQTAGVQPTHSLVGD